jgi:hypothetical protein
MSSQPAHTAGPGSLPQAERELYEGPDPLLQRRRSEAARVRRKRLLAADICIGAALALFGLIAAPGLAILALAALLALALCGLWIAIEKLHARRAARGPGGQHAIGDALRRRGRQ